MVILYSTHCPMCSLVERKLKEKGVKYKECNDVTEIMKLGYTHVPLLKVDNKLFTDIKDILREIESL